MTYRNKIVLGVSEDKNNTQMIPLMISTPEGTQKTEFFDEYYQINKKYRKGNEMDIARNLLHSVLDLELDLKLWIDNISAGYQC